MEIFVTADLNDGQIARLRELAGDDILHVHGCFDEDAEIEPAFAACEVGLGNAPVSWLPRAPSLRWMQLDSVGFGEYRVLDWPVLGERITLTNLAGFFADPVAESALAGILALYRGIDRLVVLQGKKQWIGGPLRRELRSLAEAEVVLFGYGAINRRLAELLSPYRCRITPFGSDWTPARLDEALAAADIVVSTVPETDGTIGLFDQARLGLLKDGALFVNFGRGSVVDEDALAAALNDRRIGGAVIDVTLDEPLPRDHPFWTAPNTILTQHSGGGTQDEIDRVIEVFAGNLARYRAGEPLVGIVDFERGY
jgi:phosphoglycerate dehydrogenase-like enzyme